MRCCSMDNSMSDLPGTALPDCPFCRDARWVCQAHRDQPWGIEGGCECGGPGVPCKYCNPSGGPDDPPDMPPRTRIDVGC